ncbi:hypothetical protein RF11_03199 [Thelohanellus kitauei]|uniref:Reverse transcriptase domain-containing protein n=1 Tax=Thelohanellus kitauei TaxID=669202 RepID=A0A0C2IUV5_THEKT|nr:hypothetical protein RF11_03199 [Thelohanellus kitauei]
MPFGLKAALAICQRILDSLSTNFKCALGYIDEIIIFSNDFMGHMEDLKSVLNALIDVKLKLSLKKTRYLISPDPPIYTALTTDSRKTRTHHNRAKLYEPNTPPRIVIDQQKPEGRRIKIPPENLEYCRKYLPCFTTRGRMSDNTDYPRLRESEGEGSSPLYERAHR